jgi:uncharacterized protein YegJ (DUF2314 family)
MFPKEEDPELEQSIRNAQSSINIFLNLYEKLKGNADVTFEMKVPVCSDGMAERYWYTFEGVKEGLLAGSRSDLPPDLQAFENVLISKDDIEDWKVNDHGHLYGGYSIRLQRSRLPENEKKKFDIYMCVKVYEDNEL